MTAAEPTGPPWQELNRRSERVTETSGRGRRDRRVDIEGENLDADSNGARRKP